MAEREYGPGDTMKVLVVADERFHGEVLVREIQNHIEGKSTNAEVLIIAPALAHSVIENELGGIDEGVTEAGARLDWLVAELGKVGINALGRVGDQDPVVAVGDGITEFEPDEIVVVAHDGAERTPAEKDIWRKIEEDYTAPVVEISVALNGGEVGEVVSEREVPARAMTESERIRAESNLPPFTGRDIFGILLAIIGTLALGLIAAEAAISEDRAISGTTAIILILAIPAFIINTSYVVTVLLARSLGVQGVWLTLFQRISLLWTVGALVVSLLLWLT